MKEMFVKVFGDSSLLRATVFRWHNWFVVGEESTEDAERSRRPGTTKTNENISPMASVLKDDHRASCTMRVESTRYQKPSITAFCLII